MKVQNLSFAFDRFKSTKHDHHGRTPRGLFDIHFEIFPSNALAIIGPSASGKTTLGLICAGLLTPNSGSVRHFGVDLYGSRFCQGFPSKAFMIFQDPYSSINPRRTVLEWLLKSQHSLPITTLEKQERAKHLMGSVNLSTKHLPKYPGQLSGGECQRVVIAAGLLSKAKILIFDEPTSMLDPIAKSELLKLLMRINIEFNVASVVITHDIAIAKALCKKALVLSEGRIAAQGTFSELKCSRNAIVQQLLEFS